MRITPVYKVDAVCTIYERSRGRERGVAKYVEMDPTKQASTGREFKTLAAVNKFVRERRAYAENNVYTPVLRHTGKRIRINGPEFEEGFNHMHDRGRKGVVRDPKTGKRYLVSGKPCGLACYCDAWAVELSNAVIK